jgi:hypothetical protein
VSSKRGGQGQRIRVQTVKHVHGSYIIKQTWKLEELHRIEFYDDRNVRDWIQFDTDGYKGHWIYVIFR